MDRATATTETAPRTLAELTDTVVAQHAIGVAWHRQLLLAIRELDETEAWKVDGSPTLEHWLSMRLLIARHTAAEWVRVARALAELPAIDSLVEAGHLSWDQVAPLTRFATSDSDVELAEKVGCWSPASLTRLARRARPLTEGETRTAHERRNLKWRWTRDGMLRFAGRLAPDTGQAFIDWIEARTDDEARHEFQGGPLVPPSARAADALSHAIAEQLAARADPDRACVVLHTDANGLAVAAPVSEAPDQPRHGGELGDDGPAVSPETARRLACDCRLEIVADGPDGQPMGVGRARRNVPAWLVRLLRKRSPCCEWPGCGRTRLLHAHHTVHWADGGRTDYDTLALLCPIHHRLVHEGGWTVRRRTSDDEVDVFDPAGNPVRRLVYDDVGSDIARLNDLLPRAG
jgi:hypothetical protein